MALAPGEEDNGLPEEKEDLGAFDESKRVWIVIGENDLDATAFESEDDANAYSEHLWGDRKMVQSCGIEPAGTRWWEEGGE